MPQPKGNEAAFIFPNYILVVASDLDFQFLIACVTVIVCLLGAAVMYATFQLTLNLNITHTHKNIHTRDLTLVRIFKESQKPALNRQMKSNFLLKFQLTLKGLMSLPWDSTNEMQSQHPDLALICQQIISKLNLSYLYNIIITMNEII